MASMFLHALGMELLFRGVSAQFYHDATYYTRPALASKARAKHFHMKASHACLPNIVTIAFTHTRLASSVVNRYLSFLLFQNFRTHRHQSF